MSLSIYANAGFGGDSGVGAEDAVRLRKKFPSLATAAESRLRNRKQRLEEQIRQLEGVGKSAAALRQELASVYSALKPFASDPLRQATSEERKRYQRYLEISRSSADQLGMRLHRANLDLEDYRSETKAGRASGFGGRTVRMVDGSVERWDLVTDQIAKALGVAVRDVPRLVGGMQAGQGTAKRGAPVKAGATVKPSLHSVLSNPTAHMPAYNRPAPRMKASSPDAEALLGAFKEAERLERLNPTPKTFAEALGVPEPSREDVVKAGLAIGAPKGGIGSTISDHNSRAAYQFARNAKIYATQLAVLLGKLRAGEVGTEVLPTIYALQQKIERASRLSADAHAQVGEVLRQAELKRMSWQDWVASAVTAPVSTIDAAIVGISPKEFQAYAPEGGRLLAGIADMAGQAALGVLSGGSGFAGRVAAAAMSTPMLANTAVETYTDGIGAGLKTLNPLQAFWEPGATWEDKVLAVIGTGMMGVGVYHGAKAIAPRVSTIAEMRRLLGVGKLEAERLYHSAISMLESGKARLPSLSSVRKQVSEYLAGKRNLRDADSTKTSSGSETTAESTVKMAWTDPQSIADSLSLHIGNEIKKLHGPEASAVMKQLVQYVQEGNFEAFTKALRGLKLSEKQINKIAKRWDEYAARKSRKILDLDDSDPLLERVFAKDGDSMFSWDGELYAESLKGKAAIQQVLREHADKFFNTESQSGRIDAQAANVYVDALHPSLLQNAILRMVDSLKQVGSTESFRGLYAAKNLEQRVPGAESVAMGRFGGVVADGIKGSSRVAALERRLLSGLKHVPQSRTLFHEMAHLMERFFSKEERAHMQRMHDRVLRRLRGADERSSYRNSSASEWWAHLIEDHEYINTYLRQVANSQNTALKRAVYRFYVFLKMVKHNTELRIMHGRDAKTLMQTYNDIKTFGDTRGSRNGHSKKLPRSKV